MNGYDIEDILKKLAPYSLAYEGEELGFIAGNPSSKVSKIAVTWRPTVNLLKTCIERKIDLLINHEPLLQSEKASVIPKEELSFPPNIERRALLEQSGLVVLRAHSNWDDASGGNNDTLADLLEIDVHTKIPYGRVGTIAPQSLAQFTSYVKSKLGCSHMIVVGEADRSIQGVAVVSGSGNSLVEMIEISKHKGADVLVSGDIQDSRARFAKEIGIALVDAGGYFTETPGMKHLAKLISERIEPGVTVEYLDPGPAWYFS